MFELKSSSLPSTLEKLIRKITAETFFEPDYAYTIQIEFQQWYYFSIIRMGAKH